MLYNILLIVQLVVSLAIIGLVLIQHGKGADAGAAFGSGASGTVFGSRGSGNFLSRSTGVLATVFFINCLALAWIVAHQPETTSLIDSVTIEQNATTPATTDAVVQEAVPVQEPTVADEIPADSGEQAAPASTEKSSEIPE
jgi:preprotein translocase subunit SecG